MDHHLATDSPGPRRRSRLFRVDSSEGNVSISEYDLEERKKNDSFYDLSAKKKEPIAKPPPHIQLPKKMNIPSLHHWIDLELEIKGEEEFTRKKSRKAEFHKQPE